MNTPQGSSLVVSVVIKRFFESLLEESMLIRDLAYRLGVRLFGLFVLKCTRLVIDPMLWQCRLLLTGYVFLFLFGIVF